MAGLDGRHVFFQVMNEALQALFRHPIDWLCDHTAGLGQPPIQFFFSTLFKHPEGLPTVHLYTMSAANGFQDLDFSGGSTVTCDPGANLPRPYPQQHREQGLDPSSPAPARDAY